MEMSLMAGVTFSRIQGGKDCRRMTGCKVTSQAEERFRNAFHHFRIVLTHRAKGTIGQQPIRHLVTDGLDNTLDNRLALQHRSKTLPGQHTGTLTESHLGVGLSSKRPIHACLVECKRFKKGTKGHLRVRLGHRSKPAHQLAVFGIPFRLAIQNCSVCGSRFRIRCIATVDFAFSTMRLVVGSMLCSTNRIQLTTVTFGRMHTEIMVNGFNFAAKVIVVDNAIHGRVQCFPSNIRVNICICTRTLLGNVTHSGRNVRHRCLMTGIRVRSGLVLGNVAHAQNDMCECRTCLRNFGQGVIRANFKAIGKEFVQFMTHSCGLGHITRATSFQARDNFVNQLSPFITGSAINDSTCRRLLESQPHLGIHILGSDVINHIVSPQRTHVRLSDICQVGTILLGKFLQVLSGRLDIVGTFLNRTLIQSTVSRFAVSQWPNGTNAATGISDLDSIEPQLAGQSIISTTVGWCPGFEVARNLFTNPTRIFIRRFQFLASIIQGNGIIRIHIGQFPWRSMEEVNHLVLQVFEVLCTLDGANSGSSQFSISGMFATIANGRTAECISQGIDESAIPGQLTQDSTALFHLGKRLLLHQCGHGLVNSLCIDTRHEPWLDTLGNRTTNNQVGQRRVQACINLTKFSIFAIRLNDSLFSLLFQRCLCSSIYRYTIQQLCSRVGERCIASTLSHHGRSIQNCFSSLDNALFRFTLGSNRPIRITETSNGFGISSRIKGYRDSVTFVILTAGVHANHIKTMIPISGSNTVGRTTQVLQERPKCNQGIMFIIVISSRNLSWNVLTVERSEQVGREFLTIALHEFPGIVSFFGTGCSIQVISRHDSRIFLGSFRNHLQQFFTRSVGHHGRDTTIHIPECEPDRSTKVLHHIANILVQVSIVCLNVGDD